MAKKREAITRLEAILDALDALEADGDAAEVLDDLNAEFEDALMLLAELDPDAEREEYADALEAIRALAGDYRGTGVEGVEALATNMEGIVDLALEIGNECGGIQA